MTFYSKRFTHSLAHLFVKCDFITKWMSLVIDTEKTEIHQIPCIGVV